MAPKLVHSHFKYILSNFDQKIIFFLFLPVFSVVTFLALGFYPLLKHYSNLTGISIYNVIDTKKIQLGLGTVKGLLSQKPDFFTQN